MRRYVAGSSLSVLKIGLIRRLMRFLTTAFLETFLEIEIITLSVSEGVTLSVRWGVESIKQRDELYPYDDELG